MKKDVFAVTIFLLLFWLKVNFVSKACRYCFASAMLLPTETSTALPCLVVPLLCWGLWPKVRAALCPADARIFTVIFCVSELMFGIAWTFILGSVRGSPPWCDAASIFDAKTWTSALHRKAAVLLGGFLIGHTDNIGAVAMQRLSAGTAFPIYAGCTTIISELLNYFQLGSSNPGLLFSGIACLLLGIVFLASRRR